MKNVINKMFESSDLTVAQKLLIKMGVSPSLVRTGHVKLLGAHHTKTGPGRLPSVQKCK